MVSNTITKRFETETGISYDSSIKTSIKNFQKFAMQIFGGKKSTSSILFSPPFEIAKKSPPRWERKILLTNQPRNLLFSLSLYRSDRPIRYLYLFISRGIGHVPFPFVRQVLLAERCGVRYLPGEITGRWLIRSSVEAFVHANPSSLQLCTSSDVISTKDEPSLFTYANVLSYPYFALG